MKILYSVLAILIILLFASSPVNAKECDKHILSWDASVSEGIEYYTVYDGDIALGDTTELSFEKDCSKGDFAITATNRFGLESIKSENILISEPKPPTLFQIIIEWLANIF